eukprot:4805805-Amphidinium_carterae.1
MPGLGKSTHRVYWHDLLEQLQRHSGWIRVIAELAMLECFIMQVVWGGRVRVVANQICSLLEVQLWQHHTTKTINTCVILESVHYFRAEPLETRTQTYTLARVAQNFHSSLCANCVAIPCPS